jgi:hypothetical protein
VSFFGAPGDDLVAPSQSTLAIRRRRRDRTAGCGNLRAAGFEVVATSNNPVYYSLLEHDPFAEGTRKVCPVYLSYSLRNLLVEDHPDQQCERVVREEPVRVGVTGEVQRQLGHGSESTTSGNQAMRGSGDSGSTP